MGLRKCGRFASKKAQVSDKATRFRAYGFGVWGLGFRETVLTVVTVLDLIAVVVQVLAGVEMSKPMQVSLEVELDEGRLARVIASKPESPSQFRNL